MDKQLKDYLHYYLGCQMYAYTLESVTNGWLEKQMSKNPQMGYSYELTAGNLKKTLEDGYLPILRKLESMTEDDIKELFRLRPWAQPDAITRTSFAHGLIQIEGTKDREYFSDWFDIRTLYPAQFHYVLSRGFDLFGLINAGLAVDKATIKS